MEDYGVGGATKAGLLLFQQASRRSGRTSRMIERVGPRDRIIVGREAEARRVRNLLREAGKMEVTVCVISPDQLGKARELGRNRYGATHFDAAWVEEWYLAHVEAARANLANLQEALSKDFNAPRPIDAWSERFPLR